MISHVLWNYLDLPHSQVGLHHQARSLGHLWPGVGEVWGLSLVSAGGQGLSISKRPRGVTQPGTFQGRGRAVVSFCPC